MEYATLHRRLIGAAIDVLTVSLLLMPFNAFMEYIISGSKNVSHYVDRYLENHNKVAGGQSLNVLDMFDYLLESGSLQNWLVIQVFSALLLASYFIGFWYKNNGMTPGKFIAGCKVISDNKNTDLTLIQCIIRFFSYIISIIPLCIGFLISLFTKRNQCLHDKIAKTLVVLK